ncbi:MAG: DNA-directed RNA polymerase subunit B'', partial [Candidatus Methanofastidiosia archaeon]
MSKWHVIDSFFKEKQFVRQHLDSYNDFVERGLQEVILDMEKIDTDIEEFFVKFGEIRAGIPVVKDADG